jgi:gamma-glutamyltranspeptidase/glutathione hydrolase
MLPSSTRPARRRFSLGVGYFCASLLGLAGCRHAVPATETASLRAAPEPPSGWERKTLLIAQKQVVATANRHASEAGLQMLRKGGSAADAAIASALVLGLVEPQSSGIGGGGVLLFFDKRQNAVRFFDGRETAPQAATPDQFMGPEGRPVPFYDAVVGGWSVGTPSAIRLYEALHKAHGKLSWRELFQPAIRLAQDGFPIGKRLHRLLSVDKHLRKDPEAAAYFYEEGGQPRAAGTLLRNPAYADVLRSVADKGAEVFYRGAIAEDIVRKVRAHAVHPGQLSLDDLAQYQAVQRSPICAGYRTYKVCGAGPPTSGGVTVLQILKLHELAEPQGVPREQPYASHLFADIGNLAFADRNKYLADPDFVKQPTTGLLDDVYLRERASHLHKDRSLGTVPAGNPPGATARLGTDLYSERVGTSHVSVVDSEGNAVSMTVTIEDAFGSRQMVRGFLLNNELTDFSLAPTDDGKPVANRLEARKRPRSSMSPTLVFASDGSLHLIVGSPGGPSIISYVAQSLIAVLDWKLDVQAAFDLPHVGGRNGPVDLEKSTLAESYRPGLEALGHKTRVVDMTSGLSGILLIRGRLEAGVDPRKEGAALGD